jgi:hypothetical protein
MARIFGGPADFEPKKTYQKTNFADIMVNLSVKDKKSVTRRIRLVGVPSPITEYTDRKYTDQKGKFVRVPFVDADKNKSFTRVGHVDPNQCFWAKQGYVPSYQWVQNVLERTEDGDWAAKILKKGRSIFSEFVKWEVGRREEGLDEDDAIYSGVRNSHCFRIVATATDMAPPLSVEYRVSADSKPTILTDEMIDLLIKAGKPNPEEMEEIKTQYEKDRKRYKKGEMPPYEDYFCYGFPLDRIFRYNPPADLVELEDPLSDKLQYEDEDAEPDIPVVTAKPKKVTAPVFEDDDEDDDEIPFV